MAVNGRMMVAMSELMDLGAVPEWTLGWRLQRSLAHANLSAELIARDMGVSRTTVSRWMNDRGSPPKAAYVKQWALRCGVPYDWLKTGEIPPGDDPVTETGATHQYPSNVVAFSVRPNPSLLDRDAA